MVRVSENVSAILQRKLPPKCKDPGSFTIPYAIGNTKFEHAMLDLGASINVMPYSIYASINLGELKNDGVIIQLADRSNAYPKGVLDDVLVHVNHLIFPVDFYMLEMEDSAHSTPLPILLGRPFMKIARTKIDVFKGKLTLEFDGDIIDYVESLDRDALETTIARGIKLITNGAEPNHEESGEMVVALESLPQYVGKPPITFPIPIFANKLLPSVIQASTLELKPLPNHLKYVFLGDKETLPVIVSSSLTAMEEEKLVRVLQEYKTTIGWTLVDIKGINLTTCMHRILLEERAKPTREAQRRLNPPIMEVVKKEIIKLLDSGVIYPISNSRWVSPVQVVPKKSGVTMDVPFVFDDECEKAFNHLKELLTSAPIIVSLDWSLPFELMCDASDYALGAVLGQRKDKKPHVIYYASQTLNDAQLNYSTIEKELLAVVFALDKFGSYLLGTKVIIYSDHVALKYVLTKKEAKPRLIRWMLLL
ncbi:uncharacterized protein [Pyrus communis]|uniref:uncharacterized protein n=1 Tax=Pyrus communis TaxID=23211 RepID=UPI0035BFBB00